MELVREDTGQIIFVTYGRNTETMVPEVVDLSAHRGHQIRVRLVDEQAGGWGHLNFDDFRFHPKPPRLREAVTGVKKAR